MRGASELDRQRIGVPGADATLDTFLAERRTTGAGVACARALLSADVDWGTIRREIEAADRSIILAEHDGGPILAARCFAPGRPTAIHDHGQAGAALVVDGRDRYERFERVGPTTVRRESVHDLAVGDVVWWNEPPDDVHRQAGLGTGAIELVLLASLPVEPAELVEVPEHPEAMPSPLRDAIVLALLDGDVAQLEPWYDPDVLADVNVPRWRFQQRGRHGLLELLDAEEFGKPGRRLSHLRATDTSDGLVAETETRWTEDGELRLSREVHIVRCRDDLVTEHAVWCTGIWDAADVAAQMAGAPMERL